MFERVVNPSAFALPSGLGQLERSTVSISGDDHEVMAAFAHRAVVEGANVVLLPSSGGQVTLPSFNDNIIVNLHCPKDSPTIISTQSSDGRLGPLHSGTLTLYTSGSTGEPRPVTLSRQQLDLTARWYRDIYGLTPDSVIVSSLPLTYNFSFIAGVWTAQTTGCVYQHVSQERFALGIEAARLHADKVIVLANPVVIESMMNEHSLSAFSNILFDTGGAPLSTTALRMFRDRIGDIREGYGLTETCSLTHFDTEGTEDSLGTVGRALTGVNFDIRHTPARQPELWIASPNLEQGGFSADRLVDGYYRTGDLARIDAGGRLRLLGRSSDHCIGGYYPRDTLDILGPLLGMRCALVQHAGPNSVLIKLRHIDEEQLPARMAALVSETHQIPYSGVRVMSQTSPLTHSLKLTRELGGQTN